MSETIKCWIPGIPIDRPICCAQLAHAFQSCTDNEAYGRLAHIFNHSPSSIYFGSDLPAIKFCPWCGREMATLTWPLPIPPVPPPVKTI